MLSFSSAVRIYPAVKLADMRKSFDGLYAVAANELKDSPHSFPPVSTNAAPNEIQFKCVTS